MRATINLLLGSAAALAAAMWLAGASSAAPDKLEACASDPARLGVSRIVEIDTKDGPRFGHQQYPDISFLEDHEVVLTFDDGPLRRHTRRVLDALAEHCTRATFFMVGRMAVADPAMVREVAARGHTVGSHTWSHRNLASLSSNRAKGEIELGVSAVSKALGKPIAPFFRFPYLSDPRSMISYLQSRDIGMFSIEVDSNDYRTKSAEPVARRVLAQLAEKKKGIILFHDIQTSTAKALGGILDELKRRGFKVVHLVPKTSVATTAEYDAMAAAELERRQAALNGKPLANRSMVWPIAPGEADKQIAGESQATSESLPWTKTGAQPVSATTTSAPQQRPAARARPRSEDEVPWHERMFDNYR